ncbi:hypothetical protein HPG69_005761 [Diceros bicornis minor]|uniref:B30.2/SPRY domain-containing protein n=1 Tax=Diceros bicornis minor TaxID=77932 RepID=A0A7J7ESC9_DICBM|nr:hypothetical protein HPG69_005761 [Diceros bicornis minor]
MEEVAQEYQEKLQAALVKLREEEQESQKLEAHIREERTSWKNQIQNERQSVQADFNEMRGVLDSEEQKELLKLTNEEADILHNLTEAEKEQVQHSQLDVKGIMERTETLTLKKPKTFSKKQRRVSRASELKETLKEFKGEESRGKGVVKLWLLLGPMNLALVFFPKRANMPQFLCVLLISDPSAQVPPNIPYNSQVNYQCSSSQCHERHLFFIFHLVLHQYFSSGKYYWEVAVSEKIAWILGVSNDRNKLNFSQSSGVLFVSGVYSRYRPQHSCWVIGLKNQSEYVAFEDSSTSDPQVLSLSLAVPPRRVGVFLDYEAGTTSFFNITNHGSLIYMFSNCRYSLTVYPYFNPWNCPGPITLCPLSY